MLNSYKEFLKEKCRNILSHLLSTEQIDFTFYQYANFLDDEYFAVIGDEKTAFLVILNSYKDGTYRLEVETTDYSRIRKFEIKKQISPKSFRKLINNGLFMYFYSGKNNNDGLFGVHRLMACLRENILSKEVDHIDENPLNNRIDNLRPLDPKEHKAKTTKNRKIRRILNGEEYITL